MASRARSFPGNRFWIRHSRDYPFYRLAAFDLAADHIQYAILGEGGDIEIRIVKVEREEITRL